MSAGPNSRSFSTPSKALDYVQKLYDQSLITLRDDFRAYANNELEDASVAYYPEISIKISRPSRTRSKQDSYGFMTRPATYSSTITRPRLFRRYLEEQLEAIKRNHDVPIEVGLSNTPIPVHFAFNEDNQPDVSLTPEQQEDLAYVFTAPDALDAGIDNAIVDGLFDYSNGHMPLSFFEAPRVDKSLGRIGYYTGTRPEFFQNHICFTNYEEYVKRFRAMAKGLFSPDPSEAKERLGQEAETTYLAYIEPGNVITFNENVPDAEEQFNYASGNKPQRLPQMPGYHLVKADGSGISMVNIGVGPSNAANMTDHLAVLRPNAFFMLGHCAGLTEDQRLGDYVLANAYSRRDRILDDYVPLDTPIPALAEVQMAIKEGIGKATGLDPEEERGEIKERYRTGTVVSEVNRNWEEDPKPELIRRFMMSRAIGLDMESATIATNGYRYRIPYGTLLCVSDKPLQGQIKMAGMVNEFYRKSVGEHFWAGMHAMEALAREDTKRIHSRKLRSPFEPPFR